MAIIRLTKVPSIIYSGVDLIFDRTITINGDTLTSLTNSSAKFGLIKMPISSSSTNDLSVAGVIETSGEDYYKFDISDDDMDLDAGRYKWTIEYTDEDGIKYITEQGELTIKDTAF